MPVVYYQKYIQTFMMFLFIYSFIYSFIYYGTRTICTKANIEQQNRDWKKYNWAWTKLTWDLACAQISNNVVKSQLDILCTLVQFKYRHAYLDWTIWICGMLVNEWLLHWKKFKWTYKLNELTSWIVDRYHYK